MDISNLYITKRQLRIASDYRPNMFDNLHNIALNIDFSHSRFHGKKKRMRSAGSAQAFIVELALTDDYFLEKLRSFMINEGKEYKHQLDYKDYY